MGVDLKTRYLGLELINPLVAASSPLTAKVDSLQRLEEAGLAAAVLPSLFTEQIEHDEAEVAGLYDHLGQPAREAKGFFPELTGHFAGPERYLQHIEACRAAVSLPIIASLNAGLASEHWASYARQVANAGAHALELNLYLVPTDSGQDAATIEQQYLDHVAAVCQATDVPVAVKIGPFFTALPNLARRCAEAGAAGLVLFNRYLDPNVDIDSLQVEPDLVLSDRHELRLPIRWIATLRDQLSISLAASSGIHFSEDVLKALLAGADAVMMAAAIIRYGPRWVTTALTEIERWLESREYTSVAQLKGSMSLQNCADPGAYHRVNYIKALISYSTGMF